KKAGAGRPPGDRPAAEAYRVHRGPLHQPRPSLSGGVRLSCRVGAVRTPLTPSPLFVGNSMDGGQLVKGVSSPLEVRQCLKPTHLSTYASRSSHVVRPAPPCPPGGAVRHDPVC